MCAAWIVGGKELILCVVKQEDVIGVIAHRPRKELRHRRVYGPAQIPGPIYMADFRNGGIKVDAEDKERVL